MDDTQPCCPVLLLPHRRVLLRPVGHIRELMIIGEITTYMMKSQPSDTYMHVCTVQPRNICVSACSPFVGDDVFRLYKYSSLWQVLRLDRPSLRIRQTMIMLWTLIHVLLMHQAYVYSSYIVWAQHNTISMYMYEVYLNKLRRTESVFGVSCSIPLLWIRVWHGCFIRVGPFSIDGGQ